VERRTKAVPFVLLFFIQFSFFREFDRLGVMDAHGKGGKPLRRKEQKQLTREMLLHTALKLFVQKGYDNVTVDDIVLKAGASKGGFYHHFISKRAILLDYGNTLHNKLLDRLRLTAVQHEASCMDQISVFFSGLNEFYIENLEGLQLFFQHTSTVPSHQSGIFSVSRELALLLSMQLKDGEKTKQVTSALESTRLADYMIQLYYYELKQCMNETTQVEFPVKLHQRIEAMLQLFFNGFIT
jgi:AcrR family transcriptional regulator